MHGHILVKHHLFGDYFGFELFRDLNPTPVPFNLKHDRPSFSIIGAAAAAHVKKVMAFHYHLVPLCAILQTSLSLVPIPQLSVKHDHVVSPPRKALSLSDTLNDLQSELEELD